MPKGVRNEPMTQEQYQKVQSEIEGIDAQISSKHAEIASLEAKKQQLQKLIEASFKKHFAAEAAKRGLHVEFSSLSAFKKRKATANKPKTSAAKSAEKKPATKKLAAK